MGLKLMLLDRLRLFMSLQELSMVGQVYCPNYCTVMLLVYGCTFVQDQCDTVALYYYITRLPVYRILYMAIVLL
jgi:hypothetical protein